MCVVYEYLQYMYKECESGRAVSPYWLQVAFVDQPEVVDFEVTVMGGSALSGLIPSLKAWLVGFARDSLISMYVMPEHWTYRLDPVNYAHASFIAIKIACMRICIPSVDFVVQLVEGCSLPVMGQSFMHAFCKA